VKDLALVYGPVIIALVAAGVRSWLNAKVAPDKLGAVFDMARTVVRAAEEIGGPGPEKLTIAQDALVALARRVGFKLKPEEAVSFIHAALFEYRKLEEQQPFDLSAIPGVEPQAFNFEEWLNSLPEEAQAGVDEQLDDGWVAGPDNVLPFPPQAVSVERLEDSPADV
jgi:hypothetical protein